MGEITILSAGKIMRGDNPAAYSLSGIVAHKVWPYAAGRVAPHSRHHCTGAALRRNNPVEAEPFKAFWAVTLSARTRHRFSF